VHLTPANQVEVCATVGEGWRTGNWDWDLDSGGWGLGFVMLSVLVTFSMVRISRTVDGRRECLA
jgi:hypothetical protein